MQSNEQSFESVGRRFTPSERPSRRECTGPKMMSWNSDVIMQKYKIVRNYKFMAFLKIIIDLVFSFWKNVTYHYFKYNNRNYIYLLGGLLLVYYIPKKIRKNIITNIRHPIFIDCKKQPSVLGKKLWLLIWYPHLGQWDAWSEMLFPHSGQLISAIIKKSILL